MVRPSTRPWIKAAFIQALSLDYACDRVKCKACGYESALNSSRQKRHLKTCEAYYIAQCDKGLSNEATKAFEQKFPGKVRTYKARERQQTLTVAVVKPQLDLDHLATMAVICGARPFRLWEQEDMGVFLGTAIRGWKPPSRRRIAEVLLKDCFDYVEDQVLEHIKHAKYLNFTVDETTDINYTRVINMSLITETGAFLLYTHPVPDEESVTAQWIKSWIIEQWEKLLGTISMISLPAPATC